MLGLDTIHDGRHATSDSYRKMNILNIGKAVMVRRNAEDGMTTAEIKMRCEDKGKQSDRSMTITKC